MERVSGTQGLFGFLDNYYLLGSNTRRFEVLPVVDCFISSEAFFKSIGVDPTIVAIIIRLSAKRLRLRRCGPMNGKLAAVYLE